MKRAPEPVFSTAHAGNSCGAGSITNSSEAVHLCGGILRNEAVFLVPNTNPTVYGSRHKWSCVELIFVPLRSKDTVVVMNEAGSTLRNARIRLTAKGKTRVHNGLP